MIYHLEGLWWNVPSVVGLANKKIESQISGVDVSCSRYPYVQSLVGKWWNLAINDSFTKPSNKP